MTHAAATLARLRDALAARDLYAYVLPRTDPHQSEYLAPRWETLAWLTGFTGSAGTAVVTADFAGVWTDSRYFLQAATQLADSGYELVRLGVPHTPEYIDWLASHCPPGSRVGIDFDLVSVSRYRELRDKLAAREVELVDTGELAATLWEDRPPLPATPLRLFPPALAGSSRAEKLHRLREDLAARDLDYLLLSSLDDIAWLANIRGEDIPYNPVAVAYALVGRESATLFVAPEKVSGEVAAALKADGDWTCLAYEALGAVLADLPAGARVYLDPARTAYACLQQLAPGPGLVEGLNLTTPPKARKNATEVAHLRRTMIKDGVALVRFLYWLEQAVGREPVTELGAEAQLEAFRREQPGYIGPSFRTIAGYQAHGAIVHYAASPASDVPLQPEGLFLLDSGGQYEDGTTDITRTLALGPPTDGQRRDFTLVLKGHIALARAVFPAGTDGHQLDILARQALWAEQLNYGHGTGHGVGFFLNVHEGPQGISPVYRPHGRLAPGMLTSNEPGLYREGEYGIRIENLILCVLHGQSEAYGDFLAFETVSLCPIDRRLIDPDLLSPDEVAWLDSYHAGVRSALTPHLPPAEAAWLATQTLSVQG